MTSEKAQAELGHWTKLGSASFWMMFFAIATFLLTAFFLVRYMTGGEINPLNWDLENWINGLGGLGIAAALAGAKHMALSHDNTGILTGVVGAIIIVAFANFGLFTEMSSSMEREGATVRERSEKSPVQLALIDSIKNGGSGNKDLVNTGGMAAAKSELADAQYELERCNRHASKGQKRVDRCVVHEEKRIVAAESRIASYQASANTAADINTQKTVALVEQARAGEFDEEQHYEMIKFFKTTFGLAAITASFVFSLIIMGTFELGHWYTGKNCAYLRNIADGSIRFTTPEPKHNEAEQRERQEHFNELFRKHSEVAHKDLPKTATINTPPTSMPIGVSGFAPATPEKTTWNNELAKQHIDSPADPAMNQAEDQGTIQRILQKGQAAAERGIERGIEEAAKLNTVANSIAPQNQQNAVNLVESVVKAATPLPKMQGGELKLFLQKKRTNIEDPRFSQAFVELSTGQHTLGVSKVRKNYGFGDKFKTDLYQVLEVMGLIKPLAGGQYELTGQHSTEQASTKLKAVKLLAGIKQQETA